MLSLILCDARKSIVNILFYSTSVSSLSTLIVAFVESESTIKVESSGTCSKIHLTMHASIYTNIIHQMMNAMVIIKWNSQIIYIKKKIVLCATSHFILDKEQRQKNLPPTLCLTLNWCVWHWANIESKNFKPIVLIFI